VFIFTKRSGRRANVRFIWWPLVLCLVLSVLISLAFR